jgi:hypothetical protein
MSLGIMMHLAASRDENVREVFEAIERVYASNL